VIPDMVVGALVETLATADDRRELSVTRPSRSVSSVRLAATVPARWRAFAQCVLDRESGASLDRPQSGVGARNPSSSASGRWQMLDASGWRSGGAWMVQKRLVRFGAPRSQARAVRVYLQRTPISKWDGLWQDVAAFESLESGGWRHWANGDRCDGLAAR
jgi:hypothetical protein